MARGEGLVSALQIGETLEKVALSPLSLILFRIRLLRLCSPVSRERFQSNSSSYAKPVHRTSKGETSGTISNFEPRVTS